MTRGFIYVMSNKSMPGLLKIGGTSRMPDQRANELQTTGVPEPFRIEFAMWSDNWESLEGRIHEDLSCGRVNSQREFFRVSKEVAIASIVNDLASGWAITHELRDIDECITPGAIKHYAHICGVEVPSVTQVITELGHGAWKKAAAIYAERCEERRAEIRD